MPSAGETLRTLLCSCNTTVRTTTTASRMVAKVGFRHRKSPFWQSNHSEVSLRSKATIPILFAVVVAFVLTVMVGACTVATMAVAVATALLLMMQACVFIRAQIAQKGPPGGVSGGALFNTTATSAAATTAAPEGMLNTSRFEHGLSAHKRLHQHVSSRRICRERVRIAGLKRRVDFDQHGYVSKYCGLRANKFAMLLVAIVTISLLDSAHADTMVRLLFLIFNFFFYSPESMSFISFSCPSNHPCFDSFDHCSTTLYDTIPY